MSVLILIFANLFSETITSVFNHDQDMELGDSAVKGLKLYFTGFLFAGFNIVGTGFLSATAKAKGAFITSVLRGFVAITVCAFVLSALLGMTGVWLAFPVSELLTAIVMLFVILFAA